MILFLFGVVCIRIAGRRTFSSITPLDIVVALIIGSNISRAMTGKAPFFPGLAATLVVVVLHRLLAMATLHWTPLSRLMKGAPVTLVRDGVADEAALRRHAIARADLAEGLRMEQVDRIETVKLATLEAGGKISVVPRSRAE
ncbi:MAG TPA: YetF domain-containing protein [Caulobacter sp.]|nr:YetF domain-containing protein [Caulobacter sp.]